MTTMHLASSHVAWTGDGLNHERQPFHGVLVVRQTALPRSVLLWFRACGVDGTLFHEEVALLGPGGAGGTVMTSANTNLPFVQLFTEVPALDASRLILRHGDHSNRVGFRETVSLSVEAEGALRFAFAWGMPGEDVVERSAALLRPSDHLPDDCPLR